MINVNAGKPYKVITGKRILCKAGEYIRAEAAPEKAVVVTDDNVAPLYLEEVTRSLEAAGIKAVPYIIAHGEKSKTAGNFVKIINFMADNGLTRKDAAVALGGGVVGDIAGFAAGCYMRGISVIQIPTTLLAAIDSSVGGKTGVDLKAGKNLAGVFHQPALVITDVTLLSTLPEKEVRSGIGEGIKYAVLMGGELFSLLESGLSASNTDRFVELAVGYKSDIVECDEREDGLRKLLNLGHTFGHAVETLSRYRVSHGEAVVKGLSVAVKIARQRGVLASDEADRIFRLIKKYGFDVDIRYSAGQLIDTIRLDKKAESKNKISFVTVRGIGDCAAESMTFEELAGYYNEI